LIEFMVSQEPDDLLSPAAAAARLMVSPITLRQWGNRGLIQAHMTLGGHRRYLAAEVDRLARQRAAARQKTLAILIVEDDPGVSGFLAELLSTRREPAMVAVACDGFDAGRRLTEFRPDLILLDLMMPGLDGFEVCRRLKGDPVTRHIRVVAMTGYPSPENIARVLAAGAEACLAKPLDIPNLLQIVGLPAQSAPFGPI
jgi:CheY-like chemotaxis protein